MGWGRGGWNKPTKSLHAINLRQTVDFNLRLKKSDHMIIFLWLCGFENTDHMVLYSFILPTTEKSFHVLLISSDKAFPGLLVIVSAGFTCR